MSSASLTIEGMTCQSCVNTIQQLLQQAQGINEVTISLPNKTADINFDDNVINLKQIAQIIEDAGFEPML